MLTDFHRDEAKSFFFSTNSQYFSRKFQGLFFGWEQSMWLNLYGSKAVRLKLEKGQKMHFFVFCPFLSLCWTVWQVEPHQCSLHQFIIFTQGPIPEFFVKKHWGLAEKQNQFFWVGHFKFFFSKKKLLHPHENQSEFIG